MLQKKFYLKVMVCLSILVAKTPLEYSLSFSGGYDSNVLRFSDDELNHVNSNTKMLGQASTFDSFISRIGISGKKIIWKLDQKSISLRGLYSYSNFLHTPEKKYWSGGLDISYRWGSYKNLKYSVRHLDQFYLRYYIDRDISINNLEPCLFTDRNQYITLTQILTKYVWLNFGPGYLQRYYLNPFTEFDLDILYMKVKLNYKINRIGLISFQINQGRANNKSYLLPERPSSFNRSYRTIEMYLPLKIKSGIRWAKEYGFSYRSEKRIYDAEDSNDILHSGRSHLDSKYDFWIKNNISENISIKLSSRYRIRDTDSAYNWVKDLKSFKQLQYWINIEWDLFYDRY